MFETIKDNCTKERRGNLRPGEKEIDDPSLRAKYFQGLEINFGKVLLVYFMRLPNLETMGAMRPLSV